MREKYRCRMGEGLNWLSKYSTFGHFYNMNINPFDESLCVFTAQRVPSNEILPYGMYLAINESGIVSTENPWHGMQLIKYQ